MPDTVPIECFLGLSPEQRWEQLYYAAGGELTCFSGLSRMEKYVAFLEAVQASTCIVFEIDFWRNWLDALGVECIPGDIEEAKLAVYTALYNEAGGQQLYPPECFLGAGPDGQMIGLFAALLAVGGGGVCWILATGSWRDECQWIDTETWND